MAPHDPEPVRVARRIRGRRTESRIVINGETIRLNVSQGAPSSKLGFPMRVPIGPEFSCWSPQWRQYTPDGQTLHAEFARETQRVRSVTRILLRRGDHSNSWREFAEFDKIPSEAISWVIKLPDYICRTTNLSHRVQSKFQCMGKWHVSPLHRESLDGLKAGYEILTTGQRDMRIGESIAL